MILVVGLGNLILRDDGVGVHAVRRFRELIPRPCLAVEVGTAVLDAVHLFERADRILAFDAMKAGGEPGSVYALSGADVLDDGVQDSLHELDLTAVLKMLKRPTPEVAVIAAEPAVIDWGTDLSPEVAAAVPIMVHAARDIVGHWKRGDWRLYPRFDGRIQAAKTACKSAKAEYLPPIL